MASFPKLQHIAFTAGALLLGSSFILAQNVVPTAAADRQKSMADKRQLAASSPFKTSFRNIGPTVMSGRVVDIDVNPADPTEFYVAYATGGLWHTTNNGQSFNPIFDNEDVIGLGDVTVQWATRTIWLGTGEANASRSTYSGIGVYKSTDNGKSWQYLGLPESHHIGEIIVHPTDANTAWAAVTGHLYSPNKDRGVYKTNDGGKSWKQVLYLDENTGAIEMDINPQNPNELYASMWYKTRKAWNFEESGASSGIYKSTDGGNKWTLISGEGSGLPQGAVFGRSGMVVYEKNPQIVYAIVDNQTKRSSNAKADSVNYKLDDFKALSKEQFANLDDKKLDSFLKTNRMAPRYTAKLVKEMVASDKVKPTAIYDFLNVNTGFEGTPIGFEMYRSEDAGKTWKKQNDKDLPNMYSTYGYWFGRFAVSPSNDQKIVILGVPVMLSTDAGKTFKSIGKSNTHSDHHFIWINGKRDSHMILGNDGGINITYDNGDNWFKANSPSVGQFYAISVDNARPYKVYGGLQDNGTWTGFTRRQRTSDASFDTLQYRSVGGGDGMMILADPRDNKTVYYGSQFGVYSRSHLDTGGVLSVRPSHSLGEMPYRFNWLTPILVSRHNPDVFYIASNRVHRSLNKGANLQTLSEDLTNGKKEGDVPFGTISTLSESPLRFGLLYAGTDDGNIHVSKDGGYSWTLISSKLPKGFWVTRVYASHHKEGRVYASFNGYRNDFFKPMIFVSDDNGANWKPVSGNLPLEPVNVIREDHKFENILYAGTDGGFYVSKDGGATWNIWKNGLPHAIPVHDIAVQERENEILLGTHGRSIYVADLNEIHGLAPKKEPAGPRRFFEED
ncbi:VPS10 domain-containing protein [Phnomibacter sp. MR]|uniref:VPS10 domain-containing protein n=1 Tax=Phnomibacter sp. MR TaxID=3042318 RepID=UPI003A80A7AA